MKAYPTILIAALLCGCAGPKSSQTHALATPEHAAPRIERSAAGQEAARKYLGRDPVSEFRKNKNGEAVTFYSYGSLMSGDHFPGLSQQEVDLWITERRIKYVRMVQDDPAPFFVGVDFTITDYWNAVEEYLTTYNRLVLDYLINQPNQALEPTAIAVTFRACARPAPSTAVAHL